MIVQENRSTFFQSKDISWDFHYKCDLKEILQTFSPLTDSSSINFIKDQEIIYSIIHPFFNEPVLIIGFEYYSPRGIWISWIRPYILINSKLSKCSHPSSLFNEIFENHLFQSLITHFTQNNGGTITSIGFALAVIPKNSLTEQLFSSPSPRDWEYFINYADSRSQNLIHSSYHLFWTNPQFNETLAIPPTLVAKMEAALRLVHLNSTLSECIPLQNSVKKKQILAKFNNIQHLKHHHLNKIQKKLKVYNFFRKFIWLKFFLLHKLPNSASIFARCYQENYQLLKYLGLSIQVFQKNSEKWTDFITKFRFQILLTLIECIPTEGTTFHALLDENGLLKPEIFEDQFLNDYLGDHVGIITTHTKKKKEKQPLLLILAFGKLTTSSPRTSRLSILTPKYYRGNGLGQTISLYGMQYIEKHLNIEKFEVLSTGRNHATKKLVGKTGFFEYGFARNMIYDITGFNSPLPYTVGMNRTYRFSHALLSQLIEQDLDLKKNNSWRKTLEISKALANL